MPITQISMVQVEDLHPHEKNPRLTAADVADLVDSVRTHGIEVPLVAVPRPAGGWTVIAGHRRLTAAAQVGLTAVPVQLREDLADERDQLAFIALENLHREQLTPIEESRLYQEMLDLGWKEAEIAKAAAVKRDRVRDSVKLGRLGDETGDRVHRGQISIEQALVIAEYADDPAAVQDLENAAGRPDFDWAASKAKARRDRAAAITDASREIRKQKLRQAMPDADFMPLPELVAETDWNTPALEAAAASASAADWYRLLVAEHASCPGHCALAEAQGMVIGCDQVATQHPNAAVPAVEVPPDPWDAITQEDLDAARVHREQHLARHLPGLDVFDEVKKTMARRVAERGWTSYGANQDIVALLEAVTGAEGKTKTVRVLQGWPLEVLVWLESRIHGLATEHHSMTLGRKGASYWGRNSKLRQLLDQTGYRWTMPEQAAILLATGESYDAAGGEES